MWKIKVNLHLSLIHTVGVSLLRMQGKYRIATMKSATPSVIINVANQVPHSNQLATLVRILEPNGSTNFTRWLCEEMIVCGVR